MAWEAPLCGRFPPWPRMMCPAGVSQQRGTLGAHPLLTQTWNTSWESTHPCRKQKRGRAPGKIYGPNLPSRTTASGLSDVVNASTCQPGGGSYRQSPMWKTTRNSPRKWGPPLRCQWCRAEPKEEKMTTAPCQPLNAQEKIGSCHPQTHEWVARTITWGNQGRLWPMPKHSSIGQRGQSHQSPVSPANWQEAFWS